ncbi:hypothetical protein AXG93_3292s1000 [Marchantia polymorpha subsp. ruderalis]|uniref:Uncharacterized protein n=1 Tax=Marchantia polymorpha subsp. ruderalis TaxID=1480154 RepID=A0A176VRB2_MARPO|nr:hypothetical protein AXG93_3292s1000 [Marchantia polymorpha subsp. ruderalis]
MDATASTTDEEKREEPTIRIAEGGPSAIQAEVSMEPAVEPSEERMETVSPSPPSLEQSRSMGSEEVPQSKSSEEMARDLTLSEEILEQVVTQYSVTPLLKYLDKKRGKYVVEKASGFYIELVRNRTKIKRAVAVKREWDSATAMAKERVASLTSECATMRAALLEREDHLRAKEKECEKATVDLCKSLEASKVAYAAEVQHVEELIVALAKRDQLHATELAKAEERRAEEERIAEELWG